MSTQLLNAASTLIAKLPMVITAFKGNKYKRNFALRHMRAIGQPLLKEHIGLTVREVIEIDNNIPFDKELYEAIYSKNHRSLETFILIRALYEYKENNTVMPYSSILPETANIVARLCISTLKHLSASSNHPTDNHPLLPNHEDIKDEALFTLLNLVAYRLNGTKQQILDVTDGIITYLSNRTKESIDALDTLVVNIIQTQVYQPSDNVTDCGFINETIPNQMEEEWERNETYRFSPNALTLHALIIDLKPLYDEQGNVTIAYNQDVLDAVYTKVFYRYTQNKVNDIYNEINHIVLINKIKFDIV